MSPQAATQPVKTTTAIAKPTDPEQLFAQMERMYDSVARRAFEIFEGNGRWTGHEMDDWLRAESEMFHPVHLEISETDDALNVKAEVPGFEAKELDIQVEGNRLTISGKHESKDETKKGKTIYCERCANQIYRSVTLPIDVESGKASATLKDGVLSVDLPKAPHAKSMHIEAKSAS